MNVRSVIGLLVGICSASLYGQKAPAPDAGRMQGVFPQDFRMGSAISGFQADMGCPDVAPEICEDRRSDWFQFITDPQLIKNPWLYLSGDKPERGPGFYQFYAEDVRRARQDMGHQTLRLSMEWSRIFPRPTFGIEGFAALHAAADPEALAYYHRIFAAMRAEGLLPLVTLNHYTLPLWMHDAVGCNKNWQRCANKGWTDVRIVREISKYAGFVAQEFGGEIDQWATLNEPFSAVVVPAYILPNAARSNPPGLYFHLNAAKQASRAMIEASARMYDAIHAADRVDADGDGVAAAVGLVGVFSPIHPRRPGTDDEESAKDLDYMINRHYLEALVFGRFDEQWDGHVVQREDLRDRLDFIGINYYVGVEVQKAWIPVLKLFSPFLSLDPLQVKTLDDYPEGIYEVIRDVSVYRKPMIVTETGRDGTQDPASIEAWLVGTLAWTRQAIADGYDVRGYHYWTLFDNYEWNLGTRMRMGLYAVDPDDARKTRVAKPAVEAYRRITAAGAIPEDLIQKHIKPEPQPRRRPWVYPASF